MHKRRVLVDHITYVGFDVNKGGNIVAVASDGLRGEVGEYARIANTATALGPFVAQVRRRGHDPAVLVEAEPCGYGLQRRLSAPGQEYVVIAPWLIQKGAGERVKTDRRMLPAWPRCTGPASGRRCGFRCPARGDARSWRVRGSTRCIACVGRASAGEASSFARALRIFVVPGMLWPSGLGQVASPLAGSSSTRRCITSCWKVT